MLEPIIRYILENSPVSHSSLEERATVKHGLLLSDFDDLMVKVARDSRIASSVKGDDVWYKARTVRKKPPSIVDRFFDWQKANPYPREEVGQSPFLVCFCSMWSVDWTPEQEHREGCDAVRDKEEWERQNPFFNIKIRSYEEITAEK